MSIDTATGQEAPAQISSQRVKDIFSSIAKKYERFNAVSSFGAYKLWLKRMMELADIDHDDDVLDVAASLHSNRGKRLPQAFGIIIIYGNYTQFHFSIFLAGDEV
jgi:hypothetical protein